MIKIKNISKRFKVYPKKSDRIKEWVTRTPKHSEFWALQNININIPSGEVFGIIGMNGAGKSTLLKILTGTLAATGGEIEMKGRVAALLELGTGFHEELTGRDNVLMNGKLLGLTDQEINDRMDQIKAFSELGDFFEKPVRTYSSGMYVRLAFSLAASVEPDVLIIDEALSVGDAYFQQKCLKRIQEFRDDNTTILFVSHDPGVVKMLCNRVALLEHGVLKGIGDPVEMLETYNALLAKKDGMGKEYTQVDEEVDAFGRKKHRSGNKKATIEKVQLEKESSERIEAIISGQSSKVAVEVAFHQDIENPTVGIMIRDRLGYDVFGTNSCELSFKSGVYKAGTRAVFEFTLKMNLGPGDYTVTAAVHSSNTHLDECFEWVDRVLSFKVLPRADFRFIGVSFLHPAVSVRPSLETV